MTIHPDSFAMICFLVLMQDGNGLVDKAPDYIAEKTHMLGIGFNAFAYLDIYNMRKVKEWCDMWKVEMPEFCAKELALQEEALERLREAGIDL